MLVYNVRNYNRKCADKVKMYLKRLGPMKKLMSETKEEAAAIFCYIQLQHYMLAHVQLACH